MSPEGLRDADVAHRVRKLACVAAGAVKAVAGGDHGTRETHAYRIHDRRSAILGGRRRRAAGLR
jgi:hypothetical protein